MIDKKNDFHILENNVFNKYMRKEPDVKLEKPEEP